VDFRIVPMGKKPQMADREQREHESQDEESTKYEQEREAERATSERVAEDIQDAPLTERHDDD
jgi:hypothetical protein